MMLRARLVLPMAGPAIEDAAIGISGERIAWVGPWRDAPEHLTGEVSDLGEVVLMPGLINAHCHLDYTGMAGLIAPPKSFTDWITSMVALKGSWGLADFAASWRNGAQMLLRTGTTTVADIETVPELLPAAWDATPLR